MMVLVDVETARELKSGKRAEGRIRKKEIRGQRQRGKDHRSQGSQTDSCLSIHTTLSRARITHLIMLGPDHAVGMLQILITVWYDQQH